MCLGKRYSRAAIKDTTIKLKRCRGTCHLHSDAKQDYLSACWEQLEAHAVRGRTLGEIRRLEEETHRASLKIHRPELYHGLQEYAAKRKRSFKMLAKASQMSKALRAASEREKEAQSEMVSADAKGDEAELTSDPLQSQAVTRRQKSMLWRLHRRDPTLRPSLSALQGRLLARDFLARILARQRELTYEVQVIDLRKTRFRRELAAPVNTIVTKTHQANSEMNRLSRMLNDTRHPIIATLRLQLEDLRAKLKKVRHLAMEAITKLVVPDDLRIHVVDYAGVLPEYMTSK